MADNVTITEGTGKTIAADDVGGVLHQRIKLSIGGDGSAADVSNTNPVPVQVVGSSGVIIDVANTANDTIATTTSGPITRAFGYIFNGTEWDRLRGNTTDGLQVYSNTEYSFTSSNTVTRTADTNAYLANDIVGAATASTAALTFSSLGVSGSSVMITSCSLEIDASALISGEDSYCLYLYSVTPPSALGDNAAFDLPSGDRSSFLGYLDLGTPIDLGSTLYVERNNIYKQVKLASANLYGYLVTNSAYTPTSSRVYKVTLHTLS